MSPNIVLSQKLSLNLLVLENFPVFHVVYIQSHLGSAIYVLRQKFENISKKVLENCICICTRYPDRIKVFQENRLASKYLEDKRSHTDVEVTTSSTKRYSSIRAHESYYEPLRRIFQKNSILRA